MVERVQSEAQTHLGRGVSGDVARHLGTFAGAAPATAAPAPSTPAQMLAADLRSTEGMRRALVAQMILERPTAFRRRQS
jgi:hypothetical protein